MTDEQRELAVEIRNAIWADLTNRKGIRQAFDAINLDVLFEMSNRHEEIIFRALRAVKETGGG